MQPPASCIVALQSMAFLSAIRIFPIKSLDALSLDATRILPSGALEYDRRFCLVDSEGNWMNGKREPAILQLRSSFDVTNQLARFTSTTSSAEFHMERERKEMLQWLSEYFGRPVQMRENTEQGFPDDLDSPGPTILSTATLAEVASWFPGFTLIDTQRRFRANLEVADVQSFWEDRLFSEHGGIRFRIGDVEFLGTNPCQRCTVPSRSPDTAEVHPNFTKTFTDRRMKSLPHWSAASRFDHFYRLAVNTRLSNHGRGWIRVGDEVTT